MEKDIIIYYDSEFIKKFEELKTVLEEEDRPRLYQFLLKEFQFIFKLNQYYWKKIADNNGRDFLEADEEIRHELMRPLSHRQYRMIERSFSRWLEEEDLVLWSIFSLGRSFFWKRASGDACLTMSVASVQFSSVQLLSLSHSLQPHESQHTRLPCPSPTPGVHSDSRPSSQ